MPEPRSYVEIRHRRGEKIRRVNMKKRAVSNEKCRKKARKLI